MGRECWGRALSPPSGSTLSHNLFLTHTRTDTHSHTQAHTHAHTHSHSHAHTSSLPCTQGHKNWVLVVAWSPDGKFIASGDMDGQVWLWDPKKGEALGQCVGHKKWITSLVSKRATNPTPALSLSPCFTLVSSMSCPPPDHAFLTPPLRSPHTFLLAPLRHGSPPTRPPPPASALVPKTARSGWVRKRARKGRFPWACMHACMTRVGEGEGERGEVYLGVYACMHDQGRCG
jgi:hypothetical protein